MEITDELYADLSKRIKAGEFLKKGATFASLPSFSEGASSASLPSLPEGADERMQRFTKIARHRVLWTRRRSRLWKMRSRL